MKSVEKILALSGLAVLGVAGIALFVKTAQHLRHAGVYEKVGHGIDEKLKESIASLNRATDHVQTVFDHIKNKKA